MSFWTDDKVEQAKKLFAEGKSHGEIARLIRAPSRNAVLGKLSRMGLTRGAIAKKQGSQPAAAKRPSRPRAIAAAVAVEASGAPVRRHTYLRSSSAPVAASPTPPPPDPVVIDIASAKRWDQRGRYECAYPVAGDGAETMACAGKVTRGSYCAAHAQLMFKAVDDTKLRKMVLRHA